MDLATRYPMRAFQTYLLQDTFRRSFVEQKSTSGSSVYQFTINRNSTGICFSSSVSFIFPYC